MLFRSGACQVYERLLVYDEELEKLPYVGFPDSPVSYTHLEIAMDLGTANTIITTNGKIVVDEPSVVALDLSLIHILLPSKKAVGLPKRLSECLHTMILPSSTISRARKVPLSVALPTARRLYAMAVSYTHLADYSLRYQLLYT